jgi:hypothetical protein
VINCFTKWLPLILNVLKQHHEPRLRFYNNLTEKKVTVLLTQISMNLFSNCCRKSSCQLKEMKCVYVVLVQLSTKRFELVNPRLNDTVCIRPFTDNLRHINGPYYLAQQYGYTIVRLRYVYSRIQWQYGIAYGTVLLCQILRPNAVSLRCRMN